MYNENQCRRFFCLFYNIVSSIGIMVGLVPLICTSIQKHLGTGPSLLCYSVMFIGLLMMAMGMRPRHKSLREALKEHICFNIVLVSLCSFAALSAEISIARRILVALGCTFLWFIATAWLYYAKCFGDVIRTKWIFWRTKKLSNRV